MKYKKFVIENFKGIFKQEINLSDSSKSNIFTLVGLNESGKTTVLEAINFFHKSPTPELAYTLIPKRELSGFTGDVIVSAELELEDNDILEIIKRASSKWFLIEPHFSKIFTVYRRCRFKNSELSREESNLYFTFPTIVGKTKQGKKTVNINKNSIPHESVKEYFFQSLPQIIYYPNFLSKFPKKINLESSPDEPTDQSFYRDVIQDVLDSFGKGYTIENQILARMNSSDAQSQASLDAILTQLSAQISRVVFDSWKDLFKSTWRMIDVKVAITDSIPSLQIRLKQGSDIFDISERSLGFTWFFSFLLFIEFRKHRVKDKWQQLFLLDEPASNLHSTAQNNLLKTFAKITTRGQLIYTTHSHHLINPEWLEWAFIVSNKAVDYEEDNLDFDSNKTDIEITEYKQFVANHSDQSSYFQPILDTLDYRPSSLEMVDPLVVVEGKNDFYSLFYILEYILDPKYRSTITFKLYPGNGAGKNNKVIKLYIAWVKKFLVLTDWDSAGYKAKKDYLEENGILVQDRIFTLSEIDSKFSKFSTEDLFDIADKELIIQTVYPGKKYSKSIFNQAVQFLVATKETLNISKKTLDNFKKVFDFLHSEMK